MPKWPPRSKSIEKRNVSYLHYGVLVFAQGKWREQDYLEISKKLHDESVKNNIDDLPLYESNPSDYCKICDQIYHLLTELLGDNDGLKYSAHQLMIENNGMKILVETCFNLDKIKKIFIFQGGKIERKDYNITKFGSPALKNPINLKERLKNMKISKTEFLNLLQEEKFEEDVLYEIIRDTYYH